MCPGSLFQKRRTIPDEVSLACGARHFQHLASNGRAGGAANRYTPTESETLEAKGNNERVRRSSFQKGKDKAEAGLKGLAEKAKAAVKGKDGTSSNDEAMT